jgi:glycosyltransferase involved in cell wall biosynthesis
MKAAVASHLGCKEDRLQCIVNGIDLNRFSFIKREPTNRPVICSVGTLSENKRTDEAIGAFAIFRQRLPGAQLRIVGEGPLRPRLEQLIQRLNLSDAVELLGMREDIPDLLASSHLLWHLSQSEGFSLVIAEAMATGLPVVGADVRGIREIVVEGVTGFRVPLGDATSIAERSIQVLSNKDLYCSLAAAARDRVEKEFDKNRMISEHVRLLSEIIS